MATTSERLLTLLSLLQARRDWPGSVLAERLAISPRTVRRDVDRLRELGYAIDAVKGPDGGYRLGRGADMPPLLFDDDQAVALAVALQLASLTGAGVEEATVRALATVRQVLPARLRQRVDSVQVVPSRGGGQPGVASETLLAVSDAVRAEQVLRFDYGTDTDTGSDAPARRAEPYGVVAHGGRLYLAAFDLDRDDWRTFRLDRLRPRTPTGPRFVPRPVPGDSVATFVAGRFRGTDGSTSAWPCQGEVLVDLPAHEVTPYLRDGTVAHVSPGRCRVVLGAWSWPALAARLLGLGAELQVVGPSELLAAFGTLATRCLNVAAGPEQP